MFFTASAVASFVAERQIYRTAVLKVEAVKSIGNGMFQFEFAVTDGDSPYIQNGVASAKYGENSFFNKQIKLENLIELIGDEVQIRYRDRDFLWVKHQDWEQRLSGYYPHVMIWPNAEEWRANRLSQDADRDRRKRVRLTNQN